jgi:hypothetical protein
MRMDEPPRPRIPEAQRQLQSGSFGSHLHGGFDEGRGRGGPPYTAAGARSRAFRSSCSRRSFSARMRSASALADADACARADASGSARTSDEPGEDGAHATSETANATATGSARLGASQKGQRSEET